MSPFHTIMKAIISIDCERKPFFSAVSSQLLLLLFHSPWAEEGNQFPVTPVPIGRPVDGRLVLGSFVLPFRRICVYQRSEKETAESISCVYELAIIGQEQSCLKLMVPG